MWSHLEETSGSFQTSSRAPGWWLRKGNRVCQHRIQLVVGGKVRDIWVRIPSVALANAITLADAGQKFVNHVERLVIQRIHVGLMLAGEAKEDMGIGTTVVVLGTAHKETREVMETVPIMLTKQAP